MKLVVVGGHSRGVGKTSLAAGIIAATPELHWTALKITQYGHGICSAHGHDCSCAIEDPDCPYAISRELELDSGSDTSRFLRAGAEEVYWARTRVGQLETAMPALRDMMASREFVIMESNSILRFLRPDVYLPLLRFDVEDFKLSSRIYLQRADAYVVVGSTASQPSWPGMPAGLLDEKPVFRVEPPSYCGPDVLRFVWERLGMPAGPTGAKSIEGIF